MGKNITYWIGVIFFVVIISFPLLIPYLKSGYFPTHDGEWAVVRLSDMFRELRDLQIPPRFSGNLNFGWGYPLFNFAYPFPYYVGILFYFLGFGLVGSIKLLFALTIPFSALFMFLASRFIWKNDFAGVISSVLYIYFPYRMVDLYVRGSVGESLGFVLFPLIFYSISKSIENPKNNIFRIIGALSYAALITSHNIMAVLFTITLGIYFIALLITKKRHVLSTFAFIGFFGIFVSSYFWIPALFEKGNIALSQVPIADRSQFFVTVKDALFSPFGYGIPTDRQSGFTYQIGWPFILGSLVVLGLLVYNQIKKIKADEDQIKASFFLGGVLFFTFLLFPTSFFIWSLPLLSEINFPWTALSQIGFLTPFLIGYLAKNKIVKYGTLFLAILAIFLYLPWAKPSEFVDRGDSFYLTNDATTTSSNELMPLWVKTHPSKRPDQKVEILEGRAAIDNLFHNSKLVEFDLSSDTSSRLRINTIYYPGWEVFENGEKIPIDYNNESGVMDISLSSGEHNIKAVFLETPLRMAADLISLTALSILGFLTLRNIKSRFLRHEKT